MEVRSLNPATQELKLDSVRHQVPWKDQTPWFPSVVGLKAKLNGDKGFALPADNYPDRVFSLAEEIV